MPRRTLRFSALLVLCAVCLPVALASRLLSALGLERGALRLAAGIQGLWGRGILAVLRVELVRSGPAIQPGGLIVANHLSYLDIPVLAALFPGRFVAKREIAGWPVLGLLAATVGTIFLAQRRGRDVVRVDRAMERTMAAGVPVLLFPEGHSTRGTGVERLHSSLLECAVRGGLPCHAVALGYETPDDPWAPAATVCWWGGMSFWRHACTLVGLRRIRARVHVAAAPRTDTDRKSLAALLEADLRACFEPIRQAPIPPEYPWPELFQPPSSKSGGALEPS